MKVQQQISLLCTLLLCAPWTYAQQRETIPGENAPGLQLQEPHWYSRFTHRYEPKIAPPINTANSTRLDSLLRAGRLYLSLQDAIALALENNIDIEVSRYNFQLADVDLARAKSGAAIRGIQTAGGATNALVNGGGAGGVGSGGVAGGVSTINGIGTTAGGAGPLVSLDPVFTGNLNFAHQTTPQNNTITTGTTSLINKVQTANFGVTQGFLTGATATLSFNNNTIEQNAFRNTYNPITNSFLDLQITQPLLQGFGMSLMSRNIRIAKNNLKVTDYAFEQQVITTVNSVIQAYWNLVTFVSNVDVAKQALALSQKLLDDNKKQVEIGTLAPIEIVRAEAQVAANEQQVIAAETNELQQETALKNVLSRNGVSSPGLAEARIVPTDRIDVPEVEPIQPIQDLVAQAMESRPDLAQARLQIENSRTNLQGVRNQMLPQLNLVGDVRNNGLSGQPNQLQNPATGLVSNTGVDPFFVGGYGNVLNQIFSRNFPTYSLGVTLSIPLRNRSAQADMASAQLQLRQTELQLQKALNQIRVDVQNAVIQVQQARAQYQSAVKSRILQEQTLDAEQKKLALGASTPYNVILTQRDLATAQQSEVSAKAAYANAKTTLNTAIGKTLEYNHIEIEEAKRGRVDRLSAPPVELNQNGAPGARSPAISTAVRP
jgi:outer membrane protein